MSIEQLKPKRILENGVQILEENIIENDNEITFELTLDRNVFIDELSNLWNPSSPNRIIIDKLQEKGWISNDFTTMLHFRMNVAVNPKEKKVRIKYYKVNSAINEGLEQKH